MPLYLYIPRNNEQLHNILYGYQLNASNVILNEKGLNQIITHCVNGVLIF